MGYGLWAMGYGLDRKRYRLQTRGVRKQLRYEDFGREPEETDMGDYKKLEVWHRAHSIAITVYHRTNRFPKGEMYGLTTQIRRAAISVAANIAEGCGRHGDNELRRFIRISLGSATELEYHVLVARDLGMLDEDSFAELTVQIQKVQGMLASLSNRLAAVPKKNRKPIAHSP